MPTQRNVTQLNIRIPQSLAEELETLAQAEHLEKIDMDGPPTALGRGGTAQTGAGIAVVCRWEGHQESGGRNRGDHRVGDDGSHRAARDPVGV
jgi:hypothetical protein